jgi:hypothetical protein
MAATHTYVVTSATALGDVVTIVGTVDTIPTSGSPVPVTITMWLSAIVAAQKVSIAALDALVAPILLAAARAANPVAVPPAATATVTQLPTGTFTL